MSLALVMTRCGGDSVPADRSTLRVVVVDDADVQARPELGAASIFALQAGDSFDALGMRVDPVGEVWLAYPGGGWVLAESTSATEQGYRLRSREDMNGDGREDLLYEAGSSGRCGSNGCSFRLLEATGRGYVPVFERQAYRCWAAAEQDSGHRAIDCWFRHFFGPGPYVLVTRLHWRDGRYVEPPVPEWDNRSAPKQFDEVTVWRDTDVVEFPSTPDRFVVTAQEDADEEDSNEPPPPIGPIPTVTRLPSGTSFLPFGEVRDGAQRWLRYEDSDSMTGWVRAADTKAHAPAPE